MPVLSAVPNQSDGPLARVSVVPFTRENLSVHGTVVQVRNGTTLVAQTHVRRRTRHLVSVDSTSSRNFRGAVRDSLGNWSEWSADTAFACSNFTSGAIEASVGSGAQNDLSVEEPSVVFPSFAWGSGRSYLYRSVVSDGAFLDESRRAAWPAGVAVFSCRVDLMEDDRRRVFFKFLTQLNGVTKPFLLDYTDPLDGRTRRYTVRFTDSRQAAELFASTLNEATFNLTEVQGMGEGGVA